MLQAQRLDRTSVDAGAAIDAGIGIDAGLTVNHADRVARAFAHTGLTSRTLAIIYYCRHPATLSIE